MKVIFFGDIVAKAGRRGVAQVLPAWKAEHQPDVIIGNVENLAHGKGITAQTLDELVSMGFTAFTSGDHIFDKTEAEELLQNSRYQIVRPANFPPGTPGIGARRVSVGSRDLLIINLLGQVFMSGHYDSPFRVADEILKAETAKGNLAGIIVDMHAEATSEKIAMGWYLDGRVSAVLGTHTHVVTGDAWILPGGTAYVTDLGMSGVRESVLGVQTDIILEKFLTQRRFAHEPAEGGTAIISAVLLTIDPATQKATAMRQLSQIVTV